MRLIALLPGLALALATDITLLLPSTPNPSSLSASTHATLSTLGSRLSAPLSAAHAFVFHNVTPGSYLADVRCPSDGFRPLRIDVSPDGRVDAWETYRGNEWGNKGEAVPVGRDNGIEVGVLGAKVFFLDRPAFSILSILKNPMILMGLGTMGIVFGLPYLMENMDPEFRAEFEEHQRQSPVSAMLGGSQGAQGNFDMAAYLAGSGKKESGRQQGVKR